MGRYSTILRDTRGAEWPADLLPHDFFDFDEVAGLWLLGNGVGLKAAQGSGEGAVVVLDAEGHVPPAQAGVPTGALMPYVGTAAPAGWLLCDGSTVGKSGSGADHEDAAYEFLFDLLKAMAPNAGTESFDGGDTVELPDLRGRVVAARDDLGGASADRLTASWADTLGGTGGEEAHTLTEGEMPAHSHSPGSSTHFYTRDTGSPTDEVGTGNVNARPISSTGTTGGGGAHNNVQPTMALAWIIKT